ncbi:pyruvate formate lyase activating enzyme [Caloranaerobacter azorensis DSM 13643]|uniref:Pyruvate formate lyase activating enzyme n=2 Tax=Caloranaerobacter azorensis TaxID=116090 RepID=A0A1M5VGM4_9FIRM|nr:pyruvate formate lyase activating enzyme [Caloranaerobacter azorensis DSM 13643]
MMKKAIIFNIQRYSIHDGGGIRTLIFFKGCPLRCPWCSNPESQSFKPEIIRRESLCIKCSSSSCFACTNTPEQCPTGAIEKVGKEMDVNEVLKEIKKDIIFYDSTGGGVTLSGGEPLSQGEFAIELLEKLKNLGIDTAIETTGFSKWEILDKMSNHLDRILFDLKIMNKEKSIKIINADIDLIKDNFKKLVKKRINIIPRIPLIPKYTMDDENIEAIINFILSQGIKEVHILPYHQYGISKYKSLGKKYILKSLIPPSSEDVERIKEKMTDAGLYVVVGGK